jgi:WD40 repeat protein
VTDKNRSCLEKPTIALCGLKKKAHTRAGPNMDVEVPKYTTLDVTPTIWEIHEHILATIPVFGLPHHFITQVGGNTIHLCNLKTQTIVDTAHNIPAFNLTALPDRRFVCLVQPRHLVFFHVSRDNKIVKDSESEDEAPNGLELTSDRKVVGGYQDGNWYTWDIMGNYLGSQTKLKGKNACSLPGGLLVTSKDCSVYLWDIELRKILKEFTHAHEVGRRLFFSKAYNMIVTYSGQDLLLVDLKTFTPKLVNLSECSILQSLFLFLEISDNLLGLVSFHNIRIYILDLRTYVVTKVSRDERIADCCMLENGILLTATDDKKFMGFEFWGMKWKFYKWFWLGKEDSESAWRGAPVELIFSWVECLWNADFFGI